MNLVLLNGEVSLKTPNIFLELDDFTALVKLVTELKVLRAVLTGARMVKGRKLLVSLISTR